MSLLRKETLVMAICLLCPMVAMGQSTTLPAGVTALTQNIDAMPSLMPADNGGSNIDTGYLGGPNHSFAIVGAANDTQCGYKKTIITSAGAITLPLQSVWIDDVGNSQHDAAAVLNYGAAGGFGWRASMNSDPVSGDFIITQNFFNNDIDHPFTNFAVYNYAATNIPNHVNDHGFVQRFDRNGAKVSNKAAGRNVPSAVSATQLPWFPDGAGSRAGGTAILSNGNGLNYIGERTSGAGIGATNFYRDNAIIPLLQNNQQRANLHTVFNPAANTYVVSTTVSFIRPNRTTLDNDAATGAAAGNGFFALRATNDGGSLAVFTNAGARVGTQIFGVGALYNAQAGVLTPTAGDLVNATNRIALACGNDIIYYGARFQAGGVGPLRPCVLRFQVNLGGNSITALPMLVPDNDFAVPVTVDVHQDSIDVSANSDGDVAVSWRKGAGADPGQGAPIARIYNADGTAATGSFYVSGTGGTATPDTDTAFAYKANGGSDVKLALGDNSLLAVWHTENGLPGASINAVDCSGGPKLIPGVSVAARIFGITLTDVKDWDLY